MRPIAKCNWALQRKYIPLYRSIASFENTGGTVALPATDETAAGNVRSTVTADEDGYLYFTSQGGFLWCYKPNASGVPEYQWNVKLGATSTSAPTVAKSGSTISIYTGYYSGFNAGGVQVTTYTTTTNPTNASVATIASGFPVQCSILYSDGYVYFNTNSNAGAGYCYPASARNQSAVQYTWRTTTRTYALGGMACANGIIVFGNDYNELFVVK